MDEQIRSDRRLVVPQIFQGESPVYRAGVNGLYFSLPLAGTKAVELQRDVLEKVPDSYTTQPLERLHITLAYLPDVSDSKYIQLMDALAAPEFDEALTVQSSNLQVWYRSDMNPLVAVIDFDQKLWAMHYAIIQAAESIGLELGDFVKADFTPHITLAYDLPEDVRPPAVTTPVQIPVTVLTTSRGEYKVVDKIPLTERHASEIHPGTGTDQSVHGGDGGGGEEKPKFTELQTQWVQKGMVREDRTFKIWEDTYMGDMTKEDRERLTEGRPYTYVSYFRPLGVWFKPDSGGDIGFYDRLLFTSEPMDTRELSRHELVAFSENAVVDSVLNFYESEYPDNPGVYSFHKFNQAGDGYQGSIVHKTVRAERDKYPWRVSTWDMRGPKGHSVYKTLDEAIAEGVRGGTEMRPSTVEYIFAMDEFHEGAQATRDAHKEFNKRAEEKPQDSATDKEAYAEIVALLATLLGKDKPVEKTVTMDEFYALMRGEQVFVGRTSHTTRLMSLADGPFTIVERHEAPTHPGTGTEQDVHGGDGAGTSADKKADQTADTSADEYTGGPTNRPASKEPKVEFKPDPDMIPLDVLAGVPEGTMFEYDGDEKWARGTWVRTQDHEGDQAWRNIASNLFSYDFEIAPLFQTAGDIKFERLLRNADRKEIAEWAAANDIDDITVSHRRSGTQKMNSVSGEELDSDDFIVVFHATDDGARLVKNGAVPETKPQNLARLKYEAGHPGSVFAPGAGLSNRLYVGASAREVSGFGSDVVGMRIQVSDLALAPEQLERGWSYDLPSVGTALSSANGAVVDRDIRPNAMWLVEDVNNPMAALQEERGSEGDLMKRIAGVLRGFVDRAIDLIPQRHAAEIHPGTGTDQSVHGSGTGTSTKEDMMSGLEKAGHSIGGKAGEFLKTAKKLRRIFSDPLEFQINENANELADNIESQSWHGDAEGIAEQVKETLEIEVMGLEGRNEDYRDNAIQEYFADQVDSRMEDFSENFENAVDLFYEGKNWDDIREALGHSEEEFKHLGTSEIKGEVLVHVLQNDEVFLDEDNTAGYDPERHFDWPGFETDQPYEETVMAFIFSEMHTSMYEDVSQFYPDDADIAEYFPEREYTGDSDYPRGLKIYSGREDGELVSIAMVRDRKLPPLASISAHLRDELDAETYQEVADSTFHWVELLASSTHGQGYGTEAMITLLADAAKDGAGIGGSATPGAAAFYEKLGGHYLGDQTEQRGGIGYMLPSEVQAAAGWIKKYLKLAGQGDTVDQIFGERSKSDIPDHIIAFFEEDDPSVIFQPRPTREEIGNALTEHVLAAGSNLPERTPVERVSVSGKLRRVQVDRHHGPGNHPSGSDQSVHAGELSPDLDPVFALHDKEGPSTVYKGTALQTSRSMFKDGIKRGIQWQNREPSVYFFLDEQEAIAFSINYMGSNTKYEPVVIVFKIPEDAEHDIIADRIMQADVASGRALMGRTAFRLEQDVPPEWVLEVRKYRREFGQSETKPTHVYQNPDVPWPVNPELQIVDDPKYGPVHEDRPFAGEPEPGKVTVVRAGEKIGYAIAWVDEPEGAVEKHYSDKHPGTGTDQGVHGGGGGEGTGSAPKGAGKSLKGSKRKIGITTHKEGKNSAQTFADMKTFEAAMLELEDVKNVLVSPAYGSWKGGGEPSWRVEFEGNGKATALIAQVARDSDQESVLLMEPCSYGPDCEHVYDWAFEEPLSKTARAAIAEELDDVGLGFWTWYKEGGQAMLRIASVPQYEATLHTSEADVLTKELTDLGYENSMTVAHATMQVMWKEGENGYDRFIGQRLQQDEGRSEESQGRSDS